MKTVATRCRILRLKCNQFDFGCELLRCSAWHRRIVRMSWRHEWRHAEQARPSARVLSSYYLMTRWQLLTPRVVVRLLLLFIVIKLIIIASDWLLDDQSGDVLQIQTRLWC